MTNQAAIEEVRRVPDISHSGRELNINRKARGLVLLLQLNKFAREVEHEARTSIIQAVETAPGRAGN